MDVLNFIVVSKIKDVQNYRPVLYSQPHPHKGYSWLRQLYAVYIIINIIVGGVVSYYFTL